ncbi:DUF58 domain-containing protein [Fusibacter sp. 3D3]|uniref:DUF58 domain-containing protein n=1 Tax=Fusibacter sp. 3D3 TaxID=1048380 RepID=UPI00085334F3|nr:DUF58 domain-containing protein [Fusibacter sp. 3D3]GAU77846.1 hypothetical protein F3D3_2475 [Fusibacter sp. 3D3]
MKRASNVLIMVIMGFLLIFALMSGSRELYYLFFLSLIFRIAMSMILEHNFKNIFIIYYTSANVIEAGDNINMEYKVSNTSYLPIAHAKIEFFLSEKLNTESSLKEVAYFKNYQMINFSKAIKCPYRGYYKIGKVRVTLFDPMMLSTKIMAFDKEIDLTVHPKIWHMSEMPMDTRDLHGTLKSHEKTVEDRTNIINIRPFERGDQLKNIHWKLSAKLESFQTKEFEQTLSARFFIILNGSISQFKEGMSYQDEENMVSYCATYIKYALENNIQTKLMLTDKSDALIEGKDSNDFEKVIEALTGFESNGENDFVNRLQYLLNRNGHYNTYYLITYKASADLMDFLQHSQRQGFNFKVAVFKAKASTSPEILALIEKEHLDVTFVNREVITSA